MPFWMSLGLIPVAILAAIYGGWFIAMLPLSTWYLFSASDYVVGKNTDNTEIDTPEEHLFWYRLITLVWPPLQVATIFGILAYGTATDHLVGWEEWALFAALGICRARSGSPTAMNLCTKNHGSSVGWPISCWPLSSMRISGQSIFWSINAMSARVAIQFRRAMAQGRAPTGQGMARAALLRDQGLGTV
jgi:hypothetical protein